MKTNNRLSIITAAIAFIAVLMSCGYTSTSKTTEIENIKWNVAAYAVVPFESITLQVTDTAAYDNLLPLRYSYSREESVKVNEILEHNDSLLSAKGYTYRWVVYGEPDKMDLVIIPDTPLMAQEVEVTEVNRLPEYGENLQVAFRFNDKRQWEAVTTANINKRIAISVNGKVLNAPQVNMPITQGACSVTVPAEAVPELLPNVDLSSLDHQ